MTEQPSALPAEEKLARDLEADAAMVSSLRHQDAGAINDWIGPDLGWTYGPEGGVNMWRDARSVPIGQPDIGRDLEDLLLRVVPSDVAWEIRRVPGEPVRARVVGIEGEGETPVLALLVDASSRDRARDLRGRPVRHPAGGRLEPPPRYRGWPDGGVGRVARGGRIVVGARAARGGVEVARRRGTMIGQARVAGSTIRSVSRAVPPPRCTCPSRTRQG